MCDAGIELERVEAMRQAFADLRAAAMRVLGGDAAPAALADLRAACEIDPAGFQVEAQPMPRVVLRVSRPQPVR